MSIKKQFPSFLIFLFTIISSSPAWAHVKWFSHFSFGDKPKTLPEILDVTFWCLMALSVIGIGILVILDAKGASFKWAQQLTAWFESQKHYSLTVMRAASAAVLLLSFQSGALFVPELKTSSELLGWAQFLLAVLLLFRKTVPVSGLGILLLYIDGIVMYGWFHMLDYAVFLGVGYYLMVNSLANPKIKGTGLITLYVTLGFSLAWLAIEKLLYPQWGLYVLEQNAQLALGLDVRFFLTSAAFVEITLGYLMMICLLQRPVAFVVTLVFFTTTLVFGKTEVIGHTIMHAALIVFLLEGPGKIYKTPVALHRTLPLKIAFACVNFVLVVFALLWPYQSTAMARYLNLSEKVRTEAGVEITDPGKIPTIDLQLVEDESSGYALHIQTTNFRFAPENTGKAYVEGEGHAHIFIDNQKTGRAYSPWVYIEPLTKGSHQIKVTLNTNDHRLFLVEGKPVEAVIKFNTSGGQDGPHSHH